MSFYILRLCSRTKPLHKKTPDLHGVGRRKTVNGTEYGYSVLFCVRPKPDTAAVEASPPQSSQNQMK